MTQNELNPLSKAWSVETRIVAAPNQEAQREKKTRKAGSRRDARKKSSRFFILFEKMKLTRSRRTKYPER